MLVIALLTLLVTGAAVYFPVANDLDWPPFGSNSSALTNTEVVIERSSRMGEMLDSQTKFDAAVDAVEKIVDIQVSDRDSLALREFGGPCQRDNTKLVVPFGLNNRTKVKDALTAMQLESPYGEATLVEGIREATTDFNGLDSDKKMNLIVITSGVDTCHSNFVERVEGRMSGLPLQANFWLVALGASPEHIIHLQDIAAVAGWHIRNATSRLSLKLCSWRH